MNVLIVANSPSQNVDLDIKAYDMVIALDGAGNYFGEFDFLVGDLDSLLATKHKSIMREKLIHIPDQNSTDLHKGIMYADSLGATNIDIINAIGGRMDHSEMNVRTLKLMHSDSRRLRLIDNTQSLMYYEDCIITLTGTVGEHIGVLSAPRAIVTSSGLKYDMQDRLLEWGGYESSSNAFAHAKVTLQLKGGILINLNIA